MLSQINESQVYIKIALGITTGIILLGILLFGSKGRNEWGLIHASQQILMLPLVAEAMNEQVQEYIVSNAFPTLSIYTLDEELVESMSKINKLHFGTTPFFEMCNWHSGSTILNNMTLLLIVLLVIIIHLFVLFVSRNTSQNK